MKRIHIAAVASAIALLVSSCSLLEDPAAQSAEKTAGESAEKAVTIERSLPCNVVGPLATDLLGEVDTWAARNPGERFAPVPGGRKVSEATYFCGWTNDHADAVLRIYPDPLSAEQAQRVWEGRTGQTSAYGGNQCTATPSGFGDVSMGVLCAYGTQRAALQVLGLFGSTLVECWHTRANTGLAVLEKQGMRFCRDVIDLIGVTGADS